MLIFSALVPLPVHRLPSGPVTISRGSVTSAMANFVAPFGSAGANLATPPLWVTHMLPSGPAVMPIGPVMSAGLYSVTAPVWGLTLAMSLVVPSSATHMLPSGPCAAYRGTPVSGNSPSSAGAACAPAAGSSTAAAVSARSGLRGFMSVEPPRRGVR